MTYPRVSVILVTYNQERSVGHAIETILAQRCNFKFEIIIGEDGSTDGTRKVCRDYSLKYPDIIRLMPQAPNKGVVNNYFDCLAECRGTFITDCAGDDYYPAADRLQRQYDYMTANPDKVCVMSDWLIHQGAKKHDTATDDGFTPFHRDVDGQRMLELTLGCRSAFPFLSAMMFRTEALRPVLTGCPAMLRNPEWQCEDLPLICALASQGSFGYLPLTASAYSVNDSSISNAPDYGHLFDFYFGTALAVTSLTSHYDVIQSITSPDNLAEFKKSLTERIAYLCWLLWKAPTEERIARMKRLLAVWPTTIPCKVRIRMKLIGIFKRFRS